MAIGKQSSDATVQRRVGGFALLSEIARGGFGTVYLGRPTDPAGPQTIVSVKHLDPQYIAAPEVKELVLDEARAVARIRHPNLVPTIDVIDHDGELYVAMEHVDGVTLAYVLRTGLRPGQRIPVDIALGVACGALQGLHAAHQTKGEGGAPRCVVHGNVSPDNILVGTDGRARLLDFGVARALSGYNSTRDGRLEGKLPYLTPEQVRGEELTCQTDVFAVANVLWQVLTGRRLFEALQFPKLAEKVLSQRIKAPSDVVKDLPDTYDSIVLRGLERDPAERWESAQQMAEALEAAGSPASPSQIGDWVREVANKRLGLLSRQVTMAEQAEIGDGSAAPRPAPPAKRSAPGRPLPPPRPGVASSPGSPTASQPSASTPASLSSPSTQRSPKSRRPIGRRKSAGAISVPSAPALPSDSDPFAGLTAIEPSSGAGDDSTLGQPSGPGLPTNGQEQASGPGRGMQEDEGSSAGPEHVPLPAEGERTIPISEPSSASDLPAWEDDALPTIPVSAPSSASDLPSWDDLGDVADPADAPPVPAEDDAEGTSPLEVPPIPSELAVSDDDAEEPGSAAVPPIPSGLAPSEDERPPEGMPSAPGSEPGEDGLAAAAAAHDVPPPPRSEPGEVGVAAASEAARPPVDAQRPAAEEEEPRRGGYLAVGVLVALLVLVVGVVLVVSSPEETAPAGEAGRSTRSAALAGTAESPSSTTVEAASSTPTAAEEPSAEPEEEEPTAEPEEEPSVEPEEEPTAEPEVAELAPPTAAPSPYYPPATPSRAPQTAPKATSWPPQPSSRPRTTRPSLYGQE